MDRNDRLIKVWLNRRPQDLNSVSGFFVLMLCLLVLLPLAIVVLLPAAIWQGIIGCIKDG